MHSIKLVLETSTTFTGKNTAGVSLSWLNLSSNASKFIIKGTPIRSFPCELSEAFQISSFAKLLWKTASEIIKIGWLILSEAFITNNTVISPNFLVWKCCGNAHFCIYRSCAFPENFPTGKLGKITIFFAVYQTCSRGEKSKMVQNFIWRNIVWELHFRIILQ